jgi:streptogramin lyase
MVRYGVMLAAAVLVSAFGASAHAKVAIQTFPVLAGAGPHDVYPAPDGTVWFTAQSAGKLGRLDPRTGKLDLIALGSGAAPHGVIVDPTRPPGSPKAARMRSLGSIPRPGRSSSFRSPRSGATPI